MMERETFPRPILARCPAYQAWNQGELGLRRRPRDVTTSGRLRQLPPSLRNEN